MEQLVPDKDRLNCSKPHYSLQEKEGPMRKITQELLLLLGIISIILVLVGISEASFEGTIGTQFTISGSGFGTKMPKVYIAYATPSGATQKIYAKVESWSYTVITCLWTKKLPPGTYNLMVQPNIKGIGPIPVDTFTIRNPEISKITPTFGSVGDTITIHGRFFTTKPKVYLEDPSTLKRKSCKISDPAMDPLTGISSLQFVIPNSYGAEHERYDLVLKNVIGEALTSFPIEVMLAPTAKVLDDTTMNSLSSISEDGMTLFFTNTTAQIDSMQPGDVIISGVTAATPRGMLRRVVSIEKRGDGSVEIDTEPASLTDAFQELHIKGTIPSAGAAPQSLQQPPVTGPMATETITIPPITFKIPGKKYFSVSSSYDSTLSGDYRFNPDLDYEIDISWFTLKKFKLVLRGSQALTLNEQLEVMARGSWSPEEPLWPEPILVAPPIPIVGVMVMTIEFIPSIGFTASFDGAADLSFGFTESFNLTVGFEYIDGTWSTIGSSDYSFDPYFSLAGDSTFSIKPYLRGRVGFYFWDMAGPYFDFRPYAKWSFTYSPEEYAEFGPGLNVNVGGELKLLTNTIADIHLEVLDKYWPVFPHVTPPLISGRITDAGGAGLPGVAVNLSGTSGTIDVTDINGNYSFIVDQNETYIITPMLVGYTFDPPAITVRVFDANVKGQDFIASGPPCVPSLILPTSGAILDNGCTDRSNGHIWDFDWSDCPGITQYHLYVYRPGGAIQRLTSPI